MTRLPEKRSCDESRSPEEMRIERYNQKKGDLVGYDCALCQNRGHFLRLIDGREVYEECRCMEIRKSLKQIERSGLARAIRVKTFDSFATEEEWQKGSKEKAKQYAENPSGWFLACGQSGSGKTHLCTAIAGKLLNKGIAVRYMLWREDSVKLKAIVMKEEYQRQLMPFKTAQCLYIDDLFKGKINDADINLAFELLDYRYRNDLLTIVSTELNLNELIEFDEAIGSRIKEMSQGHRVWIAKDRKKNYRYKGEKNDI